MNVSISSGARVRNLRQALTPKDSFDYLIAVYFLFLLIGFWTVTRVQLFADGFAIVSPNVVSGDEPHYLLVLNSILFDHDLELQDDYRRAETGPDAGNVDLPDHHTILVNRETGRHARWFVGSFRDVNLGTGPDVYEVSAHPVAYPALLAAFLAPFHPKMEDVQRDASLVIVLVCWLTTLLTFRLARRAGMDRGQALLATVLLALASPWLAYNRSFYPEPMIGLAAVAALLALESDRPILAGFGAAGAALFQPSMAVIGAGFVLERILLRRWSQAVKISIVLVAVGAGLMAFNYWLAYTPLIAGTSAGPWPFGSNTAMDFQSLTDSLLGKAHGLFVWCPWAIFAIFPIGLAFCSPATAPRILNEMRLPLFLHVTLLGAWSVNTGMSYGPRHWVGFLPWLAVAAVETLASSRKVWRVTFYVILAISIPMAILGALRYPQLFALSPWYLWPTTTQP